MAAGGFQLLTQPGGHVEPGIWIAPATVGDVTYDVPVDLIVPEAVATGGGRRGARLGAHGNRAARRAIGLEGALVDHTAVTITALEPNDGRSLESSVVRFPVPEKGPSPLSITATEARARLFPLIEEINEDQQAVEVVSKRGTVFLVPADEYRSLTETVYLLRSPRNAERLRESLAELEAGEIEAHELLR